MRSLYDSFMERHKKETGTVSLDTFRHITEPQLPDIRVSMRTRGICDFCFIYRERVRTLSGQRLAAVAEVWVNHLDDARLCKNICRDSQTKAMEVHRNPPTRLRFATIFYDLVRQLSIPMMSDQTMNEFFAEKKGYDVNLLGIVDEGLIDNGTQYNYISGEGAHHGSNTDTSIVYHLFENTSPFVGRAQALHLHSDSALVRRSAGRSFFRRIKM